jgi:hypothetical protein
MFSTKSRSLKESGKRSFTINNAYHIDGCTTKFTRKDYEARLTGNSAQRAAMKALTGLCKVKKIKGQCALYIEMRETTQGSKHKIYAYKCKRVKKDTPLVIGDRTYNYDMICTPVNSIPTKKCSKSRKSSGSMRSQRSISKSKKSKLSRKMKSKSKSKKTKSKKH